MATTSRKGQKAKPWTDAEEKRLIANVEKHVLCLSKAFKATSQEIGRSESACAGHWYQKTSKNCGAKILTASGKHVAVNRKNSKGQPITLPLYKRLLKVLGLSY